MLCRCGCGCELVKHDYETLKQWEKRKASGLYRAKCRKNLPAAPKAERPKPSLELLSCNYSRGEMVEQEKEKTPRDAAYLDWIRTFDCVGCGWPAHMGCIEAHHVRTGGMAIKGGDYETVSLCSPEARGCHAKADKTPASVKKYLPIALMFNALWIKAGHKMKKGGE